MSKFKEVVYKISSIIVTGLIIILTGLALFTLVTRDRIGAECEDGWNSRATGSGACSHHDGVDYWEYRYWWD